jgi:hypothetical protein
MTLGGCGGGDEREQLSAARIESRLAGECEFERDRAGAIPAPTDLLELIRTESDLNRVTDEFETAWVDVAGPEAQQADLDRLVGAARDAGLALFGVDSSTDLHSYANALDHLAEARGHVAEIDGAADRLGVPDCGLASSTETWFDGAEAVLEVERDEAEAASRPLELTGDYTDDIAAACARFGSAAFDLPRTGFSQDADAVLAASSFRSALDAFVEDLERIPPTEALASEHRTMIDEARELSSFIGDVITGQAGDDPEATIDDLDRREAALADALGAVGC